MFGPRRPSAITLDQAAAANASRTATFGVALVAGDLVIYFRRWASGTPPNPPSGFTAGDTFAPGTSGAWAWGIAAGGETTFLGESGGSTNHSCAVALKGARRSQVLQVGTPNTGTGTAVTIPALSFQNPGRSFGVGLVITDTINTPVSTTAPVWHCGSGFSGFLNIVGSGAPIDNWPGYGLTLGASGNWKAWSLEVMSL